VPGARAHDGQPAARHRSCVEAQARVELLLAFGDALLGGGLERLQLRVVVGRPDVLHPPCAPAGRPHDLHRPMICTARAPDAVLTVRT
jgi:hypothetical protein